MARFFVAASNIFGGIAYLNGEDLDHIKALRIRDGEMFVEAHQLQRAVTPGQSLVLYQGDVCLGGGIEEEASMQPFV